MTIFVGQAPQNIWGNLHSLQTVDSGRLRRPLWWRRTHQPFAIKITPGAFPISFIQDNKAGMTCKLVVKRRVSPVYFHCRRRLNAKRGWVAGCGAFTKWESVHVWPHNRRECVSVQEVKWCRVLRLLIMVRCVALSVTARNALNIFGLLYSRGGNEGLALLTDSCEKFRPIIHETQKQIRHQDCEA
jgi:hypothetical protein